MKKEYMYTPHPLKTEMRLMSSKDAQEYFEWYVSKINVRIDYLCHFTKISLDFSPQSLIKLWGWFLRNANVEATPKKRLDEIEKKYQESGSPFAQEAVSNNTRQFTVGTEYMIQDIAMYLGEMFVRNYPEIYWSYYTKPKTDVFRNSPLLLGFPNEVYPDKPGAPFCPAHMVKVQASRILRGTALKKDLYEVYMKWQDKLNNTRGQAPCIDNKSASDVRPNSAE